MLREKRQLRLMVSQQTDAL